MDQLVKNKKILQQRKIDSFFKKQGSNKEMNKRTSFDGHGDVLNSDIKKIKKETRSGEIDKDVGSMDCEESQPSMPSHKSTEASSDCGKPSTSSHVVAEDLASVGCEKPSTSSNGIPEVTHDFYVVSCDYEWVKKTREVLKKKKPNLKILTEKDAQLGSYFTDSFTQLLNKSKIVIVGFSAAETLQTSRFVAEITAKKMNKPLVAIKLTNDASVPEGFDALVQANAWDEDLHDRLLETLDSYENESSRKPFEQITTGGKFQTEYIDACQLKQQSKRRYKWEKPGEQEIDVILSSSAITTENPDHLLDIKHENLQNFNYRTFIDKSCKAVYKTENHQILEDCSPDYLSTKDQKENAVIGVINGLHYLHSNNIRHGNLSIATVVIDRIGNVKLQEFGFTKTNESKIDDGWKGRLEYMASDIDGLIKVAWHLLTWKEFLYNGQIRKQYNISGYSDAKTTKFFNACLGKAETEKPPIFEIFCWFSALFKKTSPEAHSPKRNNPFRLKKKKNLKCKRCKKPIEEELIVTHSEFNVFANEHQDVHYCLKKECIKKKNPGFNGELFYDEISQPVVNINDIDTLKSREFTYHQY